jgi:hypothetical protein
MLPLPKGLVIDRDLEEEKDLLAKTREYLESSDRQGFHVSDLIDERIAYFRRVKGWGIPDRLLNMFIVGQVAHAIIEVVKGITPGEYKADGTDYTKPDGGTRHNGEIYWSPDFVNYKGEPDEIKTTRSFYLPKAPYLPDDDTYHMYLEQLLSYMALEDKTTGRLTILYLNSKGEDGRTAPQFFVWKVTTSPEALSAVRLVLNRKLQALKDAIAAKNPYGLSLCRAWKCKDCEFWEDCKPEGRYGIDPKEWLPKKAKDDSKKAAKSKSRG